LSNIRVWGLDRSHLEIDPGLEPERFFASADEAAPYYTKQPVGTGSGQVGIEAWKASRHYNEVYKPAGAEDVLGLVAIDANRIGCVVAVPLPEITRLKPREVRAYSQLAAHLATGHRLRSGLANQNVSRSPEAILRPDGTVEHATDNAKPARAQEALRRLALGIDRARTDLRRDDPDRALEIWTAMVSGRWTLVDQFHDVGKRFLIARRNDPKVAEPANLTLRERQIASYVALGHSNKLIAYELGIAASTVATHLTSAQAKLGVKNRVELIRVLMGATET
jgi:DNA-binding CsgD family transcriptional regulator